MRFDARVVLEVREASDDDARDSCIGGDIALTTSVEAEDWRDALQAAAKLFLSPADADAVRGSLS